MDVHHRGTSTVQPLPELRHRTGRLARMAIGLLLLLYAGGCASNPGPTSAAPAPTAAEFAASHFPAEEDLEVMLRYLVEDGETPGIVLGLLDADGSTRILWHGSAGADALPLGPKSVFELGSITKAFTGILLADMVDRGEVSLSDPVELYLPDGVTVPSRNGREITLLDLTTHRSGLTRMPANMVREDGGPRYPEYTIQDLYDWLSTHELRRDIGAEFEYSNIGTALLGHALERAAGASYEQLMRERILDPLGMTMTSTIVDGDVRRWMTQGHGEDGTVAPYRNWPNLPAMGAMRSNAEDMLAFLAAQVDSGESRLHRVLRDGYEVRAHINERVASGLNWQVLKVSEDRSIVGHTGGTAGFSTRVAFDPDLGVGVVRLANVSGFGDDLALDLLRRGRPLELPVVQVPSGVLESYVGEYEAPFGSLFVRLEPEGWLTVQTPDNVRFRMFPESESRFYLRRTPWRFTFTTDDAGEVTGVVADLEGREVTGSRVSDTTPPPAVVAGNAALDIPLTPDELDRYVGTYAVRIGEQPRVFEMFVEDGRLMGRPEGDPAVVLLYQGEHEFKLQQDPDIRVVFTVDGQRAESVTIHQSGRSFSGDRKR